MRLLAGVYELGPEPAVSVAGRGLTYGELREAAAAVARELDGASRVAVWAEPTLEAVVASVAALCAGVALVPVNPRLGRGELEHVLGDSRPDVVVGAPGLLAGARSVTVDVSARGGELPEPTAADDEDPALIVYTSGTTGRPKGAVLPRRAVASNLDALADAWAWTAADVLAHGLPLFHVHGLVIGRVRPAAPRWRAAAPRPVRAGRGGGCAPRRRDDAVRRPDDVPPARARGRRRPRDRRRPARRPPARVRLGAAPGAGVRPHRGAHAASRSSSATG